MFPMAREAEQRVPLDAVFLIKLSGRHQTYADVVGCSMEVVLKVLVASARTNEGVAASCLSRAMTRESIRIQTRPERVASRAPDGISPLRDCRPCPECGPL